MSRATNTLTTNQLSLLETLAGLRTGVQLGQLCSCADIAGGAVPHALRKLLALGHAASTTAAKRQPTYAITTQGRKVLGLAAPVRCRTTAAPIYGPATTTGTYDGAELRRPPARGDACLLAFRLPSRGIRA